MSQKNKIILSLGSNLGNKINYLTTAVAILSKKTKGVEVYEASSVYETSPVDHLPERQQPNYYNLIISGGTTLSPSHLLSIIQNIERHVLAEAEAEGFPHYKKKNKGPRYLDIDIIFFGEKSINTPKLQVPPSSYRERLFVLIPLLEIEPEWVDPVTTVSVKQLVESQSFFGQVIEKLESIDINRY